MKKNFDRPLKTLEGQEIKDDKKGNEVVTLKSTSVRALMNNYQDEINLSGTEKLARYKLAEKIYESEDKVEVTAEEIALIKKLIAKGFSILVVGQAYQMLDDND